jgi:hypothetical protein
LPDIVSSAPEVTDDDRFWIKNRAEFLARKSTVADPNACGTCRGNVAAGEPVEHEGCAQRATLLHAPDHPYYEILAGFSLEENEKLPPRFHVPVFDDCGMPNSWLCAVCWEEGTVVGWPCATATKYGTQVFTSLHAAETAQEKQTAELEWLRAENARLRLAWQSARERAQSHGETVLRVVNDREAYQGWLKQEQTYTQHLQARIAELSAAAPVQQHYDKVPDPLDGCHWCACGNRWPCKDAPAVTA